MVARFNAKTAAIEIVPDRPCTYAFYCSVSGHRPGGIEGTIVVEAA